MRKRHEERSHRIFANTVFADPQELLKTHFSTWSDCEHVNYKGFEIALDHMGGIPNWHICMGGGFDKALGRLRSPIWRTTLVG
jgi:hypothetical protein